MILLLVVLSWLVVLALVTCLCAAARVGDRAELVRAAAGWEHPDGSPREPAERQLEISARTGLRAAGSRASLLDRDGVAA